LLRWYSRALAVRREEILPLIAGIERAGCYEIIGDGAVAVRWRTRPGAELMLAANLSDVPVAEFPPARSHVIWTEGQAEDDGRTLGPWTVMWSLDREDA
jgi:hypothetical protein